jgi:hypothetical protein
MAMNKVNNYSQVDSNILELQLTTDKAYKSQHTLTLTNYNNTTVPAIAAGSAIEVNGTLYKADTEEAISTTDPVTSATVADGTVYVVIVPGATTATAAFTATAPTWSDSKQGWYGTGDYANYRYAEYQLYKATSAYSKGSIDMIKKSYINVTNTNLQSITNTDPVKVVFNSVIFDSKNEFDATTNYRFTAKNRGYYLVSGNVFLSASDSNTDLILYKNGSAIEASKVLTNNFGDGNAVFSYMAILNSGDYLEIFCNGDSSYSITISATRLNIIQVA